MPEVSLVCILDADKQGFLRSYRSLIQTVGRAARNSNGRVIMYADHISEAMEEAITETARRREIQMEYNERHGIIPQTIVKALPSAVSIKRLEDDKKSNGKKKLTLEEKIDLINELEEEMHAYAKDLNFEMAAQIRDAILELKAGK